MVTLVAASLQEIRNEWQYLDMGIGAVIQRCKADFIPADVYREISEGEAFVFWVMDTGRRMGFTIVTEGTDRYSRKKVLSLDMTYLEPAAVDLHGLSQKVDLLAESIGAERVEWFSPRKGWLKVMEQIGYEADSMLFSREVGYG